MPSFVFSGGSKFSSHRNFRGKWTSSPRMAFSSSAACSGSVSQRRSSAEYSFSSRKLWTLLWGRHLKTCTPAGPQHRRNGEKTNLHTIPVNNNNNNNNGNNNNKVYSSHLFFSCLWFDVYLVINGGVQFSSFIPGQEEEIITDWIINIDTGILTSSNKNTGNENKEQLKVLFMYTVMTWNKSPTVQWTKAENYKYF